MNECNAVCYVYEQDERAGGRYGVFISTTHFPGNLAE